MSNSQPSLSYKDAGVDIDAGDHLVERIKSVAKRTKRPEVLGGLGGFASLCEIPAGYKQPVLVSGTDGVGTKLRLALQLNRHESIGIDLVAMCVNDLVVCGAEPLFFLDYYATGHLSVDTAATVITGIGEGCLQAGCALVGGETAEMPGMYEGEDYDLAGFCTGVVEKSEIIDGSKVSVGDVLIGIAASGPHSNGYSLIRKILSQNEIDLTASFAGSTIGNVLLTPTKIYVKPLLKLFKKVSVHALAHITGGGLIDNLPRVLPNNTCAFINKNSWERPEIFSWLQRQGNIADEEMYRTFNCGIGMVLCVAKQDVMQTIACLKESGEVAWPIGIIEKTTETAPSVVIDM